MELYTNARFISCEKENRIYTAMAVKGGHIVWLGDESSIPPRYGKAKRVDLGGATVTPAFGDTHMHFGSLCVFENTFYLMDVKNFAEAKAAVRRYADSHRKNKVLMGYGCTANTVAEHRLPEKRDLDDWTERPLMVMKYDGHAAVCNSAMLALLSDKVKSDPGCNTETGWLYQSAFYNGVNEATAYIPTMDIIRGLSGGAEYLASVGIGLVHTVEGVGFANDLDIDMIKILAPGLPQAFRIFFQTMDLKAVKKHGFKRVGGCFKLALDGCFGSEDAALKEPYANDPNNYGVLNYPQERVNEFAIGANREGWQITMHAIGDAEELLRHGGEPSAEDARQPELLQQRRENEKRQQRRHDHLRAESQPRARTLERCLRAQQQRAERRQRCCERDVVAPFAFHRHPSQKYILVHLYACPGLNLPAGA